MTIEQLLTSFLAREDFVPFCNYFKGDQAVLEVVLRTAPFSNFRIAVGEKTGEHGLRGLLFVLGFFAYLGSKNRQFYFVDILLPCMDPAWLSTQITVFRGEPIIFSANLPGWLEDAHPEIYHLFDGMAGENQEERTSFFTGAYAMLQLFIALEVGSTKARWVM